MAELSHRPEGHMGTGGFPQKVSDPNFGNGPTITTGSRGGWITDVITGVPVVRQWTLREIARGCRIREGGINPSFLALDSAIGTRALAMCVPQNVADEILVRLIRAYTTEDADGLSPEGRFLLKHHREHYPWLARAPSVLTDPTVGGSISEEHSAADLKVVTGADEI